MFHRVRDVNFFAVDARIFKRCIQQSPGWPDEWPALSVFLIARLFADVPADERAAILGGTLARLLGFDAKVAAA